MEHIHYKYQNQKSPKAQQFQDLLLDEIRFDPEINSLWIKYRFNVKLPSFDDESVVFDKSADNLEFEKLKDFILNCEQLWAQNYYKNKGDLE